MHYYKKFSIENKYRSLACRIIYLFRRRIIKDRNKVYITIFFDYEDKYANKKVAYASRRGIETILKILAKYKVKATFNIVGKLIYDIPEIVKQILNDNHEIACHSYNHSIMTKMTYDEIILDLQCCQEASQKILNISLKGFRSPQSRWDFKLLKALSQKKFIWNAENDSAPFPYIIKSNNLRTLWRLPVRIGDYNIYKYPEITPKKALLKLKNIVYNILQKKIYGAIGFHPWVQGQDKERLIIFEEFIAELSDRKDIKLVTFGELVDLLNRLK